MSYTFPLDYSKVQEFVRAVKANPEQHAGEDAVIPPAVTAAYRRRPRAAERVEVMVLEGAGHLLHRWLAERPEEAARVQARVLATLDGLA